MVPPLLLVKSRCFVLQQLHLLCLLVHIHWMRKCYSRLRWPFWFWRPLLHQFGIISRDRHPGLMPQLLSEELLLSLRMLEFLCQSVYSLHAGLQTGPFGSGLWGSDGVRLLAVFILLVSVVKIQQGLQRKGNQHELNG